MRARDMVLVVLDSSVMDEPGGPYVADVTHYLPNGETDVWSTGVILCEHTERIGEDELRCFDNGGLMASVSYPDVAEVLTLAEVRDRLLGGGSDD